MVFLVLVMELMVALVEEALQQELVVPEHLVKVMMAVMVMVMMALLGQVPVVVVQVQQVKIPQLIIKVEMEELEVNG